MDPQNLRLNRITAPVSTGKAPRHQPGEYFLRGPIPMKWLSAASKASGRGSGLKVALALWYLSGLNGQSHTVKLQTAALRFLGVDRHAAYRGLKVLEDAGLVRVQRHPGRTPVVTLLGPGA